MVVDLTDEQVEALKPLFAECEENAMSDKLGMLVAQPFKSLLSGKYQMRVGFLPHDKAKLLKWQATERITVSEFDGKE